MTNAFVEHPCITNPVVVHEMPLHAQKAAFMDNDARPPHL